MYCADKTVKRADTSDAWTRTLNLVVPVSDVQLWNGAKATLVKALSFLSGDHWALEFVDDEDLVPGADPLLADYDGVSLFSGGLDSLAGVIDFMEAGKRLVLVGHHDSALPEWDPWVPTRRLLRRPAGEHRTAIEQHPAHRSLTIHEHDRRHRLGLTPWTVPKSGCPMEEGGVRPGRSAPVSGADGGRSWAGRSARCTVAPPPRWPRLRSAVYSTRPRGLRAGGSVWMASDRRTLKRSPRRDTSWELRTQQVIRPHWQAVLMNETEPSRTLSLRLPVVLVEDFRVVSGAEDRSIAGEVRHLMRQAVARAQNDGRPARQPTSAQTPAGGVGGHGTG